MTSILLPPPKVKSGEIAEFLEADAKKKIKLAATNPKYNADKKLAMEIYRTLHDPLAKYHDTIVGSTKLTLKEVLNNYWFPTPEAHYLSFEYDTFSRVKWNRQIDPVEVAKKVNTFLIDGYEFNISVVNAVGGIIEGQHRLAALKYLKAAKNQLHPYIFDILPNGDVNNITTFNTGRSDWDPLDKLESGMELNLLPYKKIGEMYMERYNGRFPLSEIINIIYEQSISSKSEIKVRFANKTIEYNAEDFAKAQQFIDKIVQLYDTIYAKRTERKIGNARAYVLVKLFSMPNFDFNKLIKNIQEPQTTDVWVLKNLNNQTKEMLAQYLLSIYNYRLMSKRLLADDWNWLKKHKGSFADLKDITIK